MAVAGAIKLAEMREITLTGSGRIRRLMLRLPMLCRLMDSRQSRLMAAAKQKRPWPGDALLLSRINMASRGGRITHG
ncbi:MAG TPA: hypothetical protein DDY43_10405 [Synechococcales bacterium UBA10510]|nr:hypothetical protein [Synechococcales bacterium UBA10510]